MEIKCKYCWANHAPGSKKVCDCPCHQNGGEERCTKCNAPFEQHHHKHITREGIFHTGCYKNPAPKNDGEKECPHGKLIRQIGENIFVYCGICLPSPIPQPPAEDWVKKFNERFIREDDGLLTIGKYDEEEIKTFISEVEKEAEDRGYVNRGVVEAKIKDQLIKDKEESFRNGYEKRSLEAMGEKAQARQEGYEEGQKNMLIALQKLTKYSKQELQDILSFIKENKTKI